MGINTNDVNNINTIVRKNDGDKKEKADIKHIKKPIPYGTGFLTERA